MADIKDTVHQSDDDAKSDRSSDFEFDDDLPIEVEKCRDFFYEGPNRRRYYLQYEEVKMEEDQTNEFKGHQNICSEQIPPWCFSKQDKSNRTRSAISRKVVIVSYCKYLFNYYITNL